MTLCDGMVRQVEELLDLWRRRVKDIEAVRASGKQYDPASHDAMRALGSIETYRMVIDELDRTLR